MRFFTTPTTTTTGRGPAPAFLAVTPRDAAFRLARRPAPRPVCDGCHDPQAQGPWHGGDDGAQFCAGCRTAIGV